MAYRNVHETFWTDPKVKKELNTMTKLLYLYFITNPHSHYSGIYYLPIAFIKDETGLTEKQIKHGMDTLSKGYHIQYDTPLEVIWVINMFQKEPKGIKQITGVANHLKTLHNSSLVKGFLEHYKNLEIPHQYRIDTPPMGSHTVAVPVTESVPVSETTTAESDKSPSASATPKISFNYKSGKFDNLSVGKHVKQWGAAYPALTITVELSKMASWLSANPKNRKSNLERFIVNWLTRAQDRAGRVETGQATPRTGGRGGTSYADEMRRKSKQEES